MVVITMLLISVKCEGDNKSDGAQNKNESICKKGQNKKKDQECKY